MKKIVAILLSLVVLLPLVVAYGGGGIIIPTGNMYEPLSGEKGYTFIETLDRIEPNKPIKLKVNHYKLNVRELSIVLDKRVRGASFMINQLSSSTDNSYMEFKIISNVKNENIDKIIVTFNVERKWLEENNYGKDKVYILHKSAEGKILDKIYAKFEECNNVLCKYNFKTRSLSTFIVKAQKITDRNIEIIKKNETSIIKQKAPTVEQKQVILNETAFKQSETQKGSRTIVSLMVLITVVVALWVLSGSSKNGKTA